MRETLRLLFVIALAATGGLLAAGLVDRFGLLPELPELEGGTAVALLLVVLALPLVLAVHELGHVLAGRLVGFEFQALIVGPLRVRRRQDRLHFGLNRSLALAGGIAVLLPTGQDRLQRRMAAMTAGGPLASLVLAGAALAGTALLSGPAPGQGARLLVFLLGVTAVMSAAIGVVTLVPGATSGFSTDGRRLYLLLRGGPEAEREVGLLTLLAASQAGVRPGDLDSQLIQRLLVPAASEAHRVTGWMLAYDRHLDRREIDAAGEALDAALDLRDALPTTAAPALELEAAFFTARYRRDAPAARALLDQAGTGALVPPETPLRARAAVLLAEGRPAAALDAVRAARQVLDHDLDQAAEETARRQLDDLETEARAHAAR